MLMGDCVCHVTWRQYINMSCYTPLSKSRSAGGIHTAAAAAAADAGIYPHPSTSS